MKTVLILDDNTTIRNCILAFFEDRQWRILPASSAEKALQILPHEIPDGAVVDIRLPGMDGNTFILEATKRYSSLPCAIVTGSPEYYPPQNVLEPAETSNRTFSKPIEQPADLKYELIRQIEKCRAENGDRE